MHRSEARFHKDEGNYWEAGSDGTGPKYKIGDVVGFTTSSHSPVYTGSVIATAGMGKFLEVEMIEFTRKYPEGIKHTIWIAKECVIACHTLPPAPGVAPAVAPVGSQEPVGEANEGQGVSEVPPEAIAAPRGV